MSHDILLQISPQVKCTTTLHYSPPITHTCSLLSSDLFDPPPFSHPG